MRGDQYEVLMEALFEDLLKVQIRWLNDEISIERRDAQTRMIQDTIARLKEEFRASQVKR